VLIDSLNRPVQTFQFDEPNRTSIFIEELRKNSLDPQRFEETLEAQAKEVKEFSTEVNVGFPGLVTEAELLTYFQESLKTASEELLAEATIPVDLDAKAADNTAQAFANCLRAFLADARGLQVAIDVLKGEADFHKSSSNHEIELLKEKCNSETSALKPSVDKNVKRLTQKADRVLGTMQKRADKKVGILERRREGFLRRLQVAELRKDALKQRLENAKKKRFRSSSGLFALKKYEHDIDDLKKEVKVLSEEAENLRKTNVISIKQRREEFDEAIAQEEAKLAQIQDVCQAKIEVQQKRINSIDLHAAAIVSALENWADDLKGRVSALKTQVQIDYKLESEGPLQVRVPVYVMKYTRGDEERYVFVTPIALSKDTGVLDGLKKMLSLNPEPKLVSLMRPANRALQETLSERLLERVVGDSGFRVKLNALGQDGNLTNQASFAPTLNEGLDELEKRGYINAEEASDLCKRVMGEIAWP